MEGIPQAAEVARTACGGTLEDTRGLPSAIYEGERIYFCSQACLLVFEHYPRAFMTGEMKHPQKDD